jgi:CopG family transcriptional regulator / antitoxin EndoAI
MIRTNKTEINDMSAKTVNISFNDDLLAVIDEVAKKESRSRSELLREAVRMYVDRKRRWEKIFAFGRAAAEEKHLTETDVDREIHAYRQEKSFS